MLAGEVFMVVKRLQGSVVSDLNNASDNYGLSADQIFVLDGRERIIATYASDDLIDFRQNAQQNGTVSVYAGSGNDTVYGDEGTQYVYDGSGSDYLQLGIDNDTVGVGSGDDVYDGGSGVDLLMFYWTNFDGYEGAYTDNRTGIAIDLAITTAQDFGIFGFDIIRGFESVKGGNGNDVIRGTSGSNSFRGVAGNDVFYGRDGNDTFQGGLGHDIIVGGNGADRFYYEAVAESGDYIRYFESVDYLVFNGVAFGNLRTGTLAASAFHSGTTNEATTTSQRFLFRTTDDTLWYDSNGSASGGTRVLVADIQHDANVSHLDILIV
jgi:Ca2+-binding RTX toxin-like protein